MTEGYCAFRCCRKKKQTWDCHCMQMKAFAYRTTGTSGRDVPCVAITDVQNKNKTKWDF